MTILVTGTPYVILIYCLEPKILNFEDFEFTVQEVNWTF